MFSKANFKNDQFVEDANKAPQNSNDESSDVEVNTVARKKKNDILDTLIGASSKLSKNLACQAQAQPTNASAGAVDGKMLECLPSTSKAAIEQAKTDLDDLRKHLAQLKINRCKKKMPSYSAEDHKRQLAAACFQFTATGDGGASNNEHTRGRNRDRINRDTVKPKTKFNNKQKSSLPKPPTFNPPLTATAVYGNFVGGGYKPINSFYEATQLPLVDWRIASLEGTFEEITQKMEKLKLNFQICQICGMTLRTPSLLDQHMKTHMNKQRLKIRPSVQAARDLHVSPVQSKCDKSATECALTPGNNCTQIPGEAKRQLKAIKGWPILH